MEPVKLDLHNFLSYREESVALDSVTCAALVGENGAGKSSLLDALTWCLFGQGTKGGARELDNYVTRGENEARVEVQFKLNGSTYRVVRGRSIARNKSTLEFFIRDAGDWRALSGKTIAETQKAVEDALRMDYRTFTASSLILQGQADAFTANMTDQERKEALARILGLDIWDKMQERAREKNRALKAELTAMEQPRQRLVESSSQKTALKDRQAKVEVELGTKAAEIDQAAAEVAELEVKVRQQPILEQTLAETRRGIAQRSEAIRSLESDMIRVQQQIIQAEGVIKKNEALLARRQEIEAAVEMEADIARDVAAFDQKAQEYMRLNAEASTLERQAAAWEKSNETEIARFESAIEASRRQASTMDKVPCSDQEKAACPLLAGAQQAAAELQRLHEKLTTLQQAINPHITPWQAALKARDAVGYDPGAHQAARTALADIRKISTLKTDLDSASTLTRAMEEKIADAKASMSRLTEQRDLTQAERQALMEKEAWIVRDMSALEPAANALRQAQRRINDLRQQEAALRTELGRLDAALEQAAKAEVELAGIEERAKALREELTIYELLDQACGKKAGVPALIVENAVPEIERLANDMLTRMVGGRLAVRLDTQAEGKTTGTMQEVLRITVLDAGSERPYQTYSGAERFMVDLALRVALSKFLAHRAGAEIRLFVLDEGLGACDATNRQAVMQAIQAVAQEFGKTLVITHIQELQDALPQRIEVTKGPDGSKVRVA